jgi:anti-sigma regulatory factor (Ser/Thr protein kinase)
VEPFEASFPRDLHRLRGLRRDLRKWLERVDVDPTQRDAVVLAVHEAAANAIEHAGATVTIRGARDEDRLIVVVSNEGRWTGSTPTDDLARGRGLTIMDGLMSKLEISRGAGRTTVRMRLDLENGSDT